MNTGERIKYLRTELLHLTGEKFGSTLGLTRASISNVENGNRNPTSQLIKSICREFGVREEWLRDGEGEPFGSQTLNQELFAWINKIMPEADTSFQKRFAYALSKLPDEGWKMIEDFCNNLSSPNEPDDSGKKLDD